jgi:hypothetical protein
VNWSAAEVAEVPAGVVTVTSMAPLALGAGWLKSRIRAASLLRHRNS